MYNEKELYAYVAGWFDANSDFAEYHKSESDSDFAERFIKMLNHRCNDQELIKQVFDEMCYEVGCDYVYNIHTQKAEEIDWEKDGWKYG
jgi:hypothetical protein